MRPNAAKMLRELGFDVSATAVARRYIGLIDGFVLDTVDADVEHVPGIQLFNAATLMNSVEDRLELAREVLRIVARLSEVGGLHHGRIEPAERASQLDQESP